MMAYGESSGVDPLILGLSVPGLGTKARFLTFNRTQSIWHPQGSKRKHAGCDVSADRASHLHKMFLLLLCTNYTMTFCQPHYEEILSRVLRKVNRPVSSLGCIQLKDNNLVLAARKNPRSILDPAYKCWRLPQGHALVSSQYCYLCLMLCHNIQRVGSGPTDWWKKLSLRAACYLNNAWPSSKIT
jgi:hypothetical protein